MSKKRSYSVLEQLLRQQQSRIKQLERELAESRRQTEAAKRKVREARTEVKKIKSEVIKPTEVKANTPKMDIQPTKIEQPAKINLAPVSSSISKQDLSELRMVAYYIPRFIQRLSEVYGAEASAAKLKELQIKLLSLSKKTVTGVLKDYNLEEVFWDSNQWNSDALNEESFDEIFVGIMAVTD